MYRIWITFIKLIVKIFKKEKGTENKYIRRFDQSKHIKIWY